MTTTKNTSRQVTQVDAHRPATTATIEYHAELLAAHVARRRPQFARKPR